jgi:hypothetical protein
LPIFYFSFVSFEDWWLSLFSISCEKQKNLIEMAGFQIPIEIKIDFLENIVIPFFGRLDSSQTREDWMTENAGTVYGDKLPTLILSTNFIESLEEAKLERAEAKAELREEREFLLQQQRAGTLNFSLFIHNPNSFLSIFYHCFFRSSSTTTTSSRFVLFYSRYFTSGLISL